MVGFVDVGLVCVLSCIVVLRLKVGTAQGSVYKQLGKYLPSSGLHGMRCLNVLGREVWDRVKT